MDTEINIEFRITGKRDGSWAIQAFNSNGDPIGKYILVKTPSEAWKIYMLLNGYAYTEPVEMIEDTQELEVA